MIEKKCKICGEWVNSKKIAMHYWNIHHVKYSDYRTDEETRETVEEVKPTETTGEIQNEKKANQEAQSNSTINTNTTEVVATPKFETETVDNGVKNNPEPAKISEAEMWKETAKYFESKVTNEAKREYKAVINVDNDAQTMNEWCN